MMRPRIASILIFLMVISPIVSATNHCAGMHGTDLLQKTDLSTAASLMIANDVVDHKALTDADTEIDCDNSGYCVYHLCSSNAVMQSVTVFNFVVSTGFQLSSVLSLYTSPFYSTIRPPILIL